MSQADKRRDKPDGYLSDEAIIDLFFARDETAIAESDRKYGPYLRSVAYHILHNDADCEECRNDTYLRAWETIPPTRPVSLGGYLTKIIRGIAINRYDRDRRDRRIPPEALESLSDFEGFLADTPVQDEVGSAAESEVIGAVISRYLRGCRKRRRYVFMARYFAMKPIAAIADQLGISESSVKRELASIKKELRIELKKEDIEV